MGSGFLNEKGSKLNVVNVFVSVHPQKELEREVKQGSKWTVERIRDLFHCAFEAAFAKLGAAVGKRPWITILICCLMAGVASTGLFHLKFENRINKLWVPVRTQAEHDGKIVEKSFSRPPDVHQVLLTTKTKAGNVLTPDGLAVGQEIHRRVTNLKVEDPTDPEVSWSYEDLCAIGALGCWHSSVLLAVGFSPQMIAHEDVNLQRINLLANQLDGDFPLRMTDLVGGISRDSSGNITAAAAATFTYFIKREDEDQRFPEENQLLIERGKLWEEAFLDEMVVLNNKVETLGFSIHFISSGSWDRELQGALDSDVWLLYIAVFLILLYTAIMMSRWSNGFVGTRGLLAIIGILCIGVAFLTSAGICSYLGIVYSPLMGLLPFLLLGVGVDNMFVIVTAFDNTNVKDSEEERLQQALEVSGTSITATSLTNLLAFIIGAHTSLPVLRAFAVYAALGIFCNYALQITLFPALLVLDEKRQAAGRYDFLPFMLKSSPCATPEGCVLSNDDLMGKIMRKLGTVIALAWVKSLVIIAFIGLAGIGAWGLQGLKVEADLDKFIPVDSYIHSFSATRKSFFSSTGDQTAIYIQDVSFTDPTMWQHMTLLSRAFKDNEYVESSSVVSWFDVMQKTANATGTVNSSNFHERLIAWLDSGSLVHGGSAFRSDIVFNPDRTKIVACRIRGNHIASDSTEDHVDAMDSLRNMVASMDFPAGTYSFAFADQYLAYEQFRTIGKEAIVNTSLALVMILSVVLVLQMNLRAALFTWINIVMAVVEMVGLLRFWGIQLDTTLIIFVVVSMGLIVDYSAHVVHKFVRRGPSEGVVELLEQIGPAVFNAAASTFFAILVLAFAKSYVFVLFFRTFLLCVMLGLAHGLILLPVLLSLWSPSESAELCTSKGDTAAAMFSGIAVGQKEDDPCKGVPK